MIQPKSHGMIDGTKNVLSYPCKEINKAVPFFENLERNESTLNEYLYKTILKMHDQTINT